MFRRQETGTTLLLEFSTELRNLDRVTSELRSFLARQRLDDIQFSAGLVCREGVSNAMKHGNCMCAPLLVCCEIRVGDGKLCVTVEDQGRGWNWAGHEHCLPDPECESGRGLYLINHYACHLEYNRAGNRLCVLLDTCKK